MAKVNELELRGDTVVGMLHEGYRGYMAQSYLLFHTKNGALEGFNTYAELRRKVLGSDIEFVSVADYYDSYLLRYHILFLLITLVLSTVTLRFVWKRVH